MIGWAAVAHTIAGSTLLSLLVPATTISAQSARAKPPGTALDRAEFAFFPLDPAWSDRANRQPTAPIGMDAQRFAVPFSTGELWLLDVHTGALITSKQLPTAFAPVFAGPDILVTGDAVLDAVRAVDLENRWRRPLPAKAAFAPVARSGWAFVPLADGAVLGLRTDTGEIVWTAPGEGAPTVPPCVEGDRIYTGAPGGRLHARDARTGAEVWSVALAGDITALAAVEGHVFASTAGRFLYALDARRGQVRWRFRIGASAIGLAVDEDRVIAVMLDQSARAFKIGSGAQVWRQPLTFRPAGGPVVAGGSVLVTGYAPVLRVLDRRTGDLQGSYNVPLPPDAGIETLIGGPVFQLRATLFDDLAILITQQGWIHAMRRLFSPAAAPLTTMPTAPLPAPSPPPGWVAPAEPPKTDAAPASPAAAAPAGTSATAPPVPPPPAPTPPR